MPTYQYDCEACGYTFEKYQSITEGKLKKCPRCHAFKLHRLIGTGSGIIFKGSGFYETDYKKKPAEAAASSSQPSGSVEKNTPPVPKPAEKVGR